VLARAYDRAHALSLIRAGVDFQLRETFESALTFGARALDDLGEAPETVDEVIEEVRRRDADRLAAQMSGDISSGRDLLLSNLPEDQREKARAQRPPPGLAPSTIGTGVRQS
jgi:glutathione-regulated potassium-efflux system protein KefB